jgi:hypothetical protein
LGSRQQRGAYLAVCAIYRDEATYLREWIEFHRLVGVERFFLYDNGSVDGHREVLAPFLGDGTVWVHDWPIFPGQHPAYDHCLRRHGRKSRWIAFLDLDEFLFSPTGRPVPELLADYEAYPGVGVNVVVFGTSGHRYPPPGLVIENYLHRRATPAANTIKSIVDPRRTLYCGGAHHFRYLERVSPGVFHEGIARDENHGPIEKAYTDSFSCELLRINHYYTRSEEELRGKWTTPRPDNSELRPPDAIHKLAGLNAVRDETILPYAAALHEALERGAKAPADA